MMVGMEEVPAMSDQEKHAWFFVHQLVDFQDILESIMARVLGMPKPIICESLEEAGAFAITKNRAVLVQIGDRVGRMTPNGEFRDLREAMEIVAKAMERSQRKEFGNASSQDGKVAKSK